MVPQSLQLNVDGAFVCCASSPSLSEHPEMSLAALVISVRTVPDESTVLATVAWQLRQFRQGPLFLPGTPPARSTVQIDCTAPYCLQST